MEGDVGRSYIIIGVKKVHPVVFLCLEVENKYAFKSVRGEFGEGRGAILDKNNTSKDTKRKGEER